MDHVRDYLIIAIVITGILQTIRSIRVYREAKRKYPIVKLKGRLKSDGWRFRDPPSEIGLKTSEYHDRSALELQGNFLLIGKKDIRVELKPGVIQVVTRGLLFHRRLRFKASQNFIIEGRLFATSGEREPDYMLVFRWKWLAWTSLFRKRVILRINQSQGSWLVAELNDWNKRQLRPKS